MKITNRKHRTRREQVATEYTLCFMNKAKDIVMSGKVHVHRHQGFS